MKSEGSRLLLALWVDQLFACFGRYHMVLGSLLKSLALGVPVDRVDLDSLQLLVTAEGTTGSIGVRARALDTSAWGLALLVERSLLYCFNEFLPDDVVDLVGEGFLDSRLNGFLVGGHFIFFKGFQDPGKRFDRDDLELHAVVRLILAPKLPQRSVDDSCLLTKHTELNDLIFISKTWLEQTDYLILVKKHIPSLCLFSKQCLDKLALFLSNLEELSLFGLKLQIWLIHRYDNMLLVNLIWRVINRTPRRPTST